MTGVGGGKGVCLTVVPQKGYDEIVSECRQIQRVSEKQREPVIPRDDGHEEELYHVEKDPDGQEGADRDLKRSI